MKKLSISVALAASLVSGLMAQTSGLLLGVNVGVPITTPSYSGFLGDIKDALPKTGIGWALGVDIGYKQALSENMGLKYYVSYNYSESYGDSSKSATLMNIINLSDVKADIISQLITANIDFWYNFTRSFGAYIGIGVGYQSFKPSWTPTVGMGQVNSEMTIGGKAEGGLAVPLNLGLTYNIGDAHQILLGAKIPLVGYKYETAFAMPQMPNMAQAGASTLRTYIVQIGYNFTF